MKKITNDPVFAAIIRGWIDFINIDVLGDLYLPDDEFATAYINDRIGLIKAALLINGYNDLAMVLNKRLPNQAWRDKAMLAIATAKELPYPIPNQNHLASVWFGDDISNALKSIHIVTINHLANKLSDLGRSKLSKNKIKQIKKWFQLNPHLQIITPKANLPSNCIKRSGLAPIEYMAVPEELRHGCFFSRSNILLVEDDLSAVNLWLSGFSGSTLQAYRREIERFCLWRLFVLGKSVLSACAHDMLDYRLFLEGIPDHWISHEIKRRDDIAWRPVVLPIGANKLNHNSIVFSESILRLFFKWLCKNQIIPTNPCRDIEPLKKSVFSRTDKSLPITEGGSQAIEPDFAEISALLVRALVRDGLMITQIITARIGDLDRKNRILMKIALSSETIDLITKHLKARKSSWNFSSEPLLGKQRKSCNAFYTARGVHKLLNRFKQ